MRRLDSYEKSQAESSDLPYGAFKNESSSGSNDGTEIVAEHMQDLYYALYQVLQHSGITPNGVLENGNNSKQFIGALANITPLIYSQTISYNINSITLYVANNEISIFKSLKNNNRSSLSDSSSWLLICKLNSSGVFYNFKAYSPAFTGVPTAPTAARGTSTTQIASTEFVKNAFKDYIMPVNTWSNGENWYRIYSDNWCEQGGYSNPSGYSKYLQTINLHIPYKDTNYGVIISAESNHKTGSGNCGYNYMQKNSKTTSSFNVISCTPNHYYRQYWETKGYIS